ncbi:MAG TPA: nucleoside diphosphate kinase regulator [Luteimonas sp.]|jgi:regulator of nucleoside diphosphate kinase|nr:nucleoside diphosphate kinase regulator [Luteimonas sp.]
MPPETKPALVLSRLDVDRLEALLEQPAQAGPAFDALRDELARAEVREPRDVPADAITMNSTARFRDEASGEEREMTLVYPRDADGSADKVSILAPVGSALLGLRAGQSIEWPVPGGRSARLVVLGVRYQPEAAGEYHR